MILHCPKCGNKDLKDCDEHGEHCKCEKCNIVLNKDMLRAQMEQLN